MNLWQLYWPNVLAGTMMGAALAWSGAHVIARGRATEALTVGQSATLGVLIGAWLGGGHHDSAWQHLICPALGALVAVVVRALLNRTSAKFRAAPSAPLVAGFVVLLASAHGLTALLPGLESHLSQAFFGDLATLSGTELWLASITAFAAIAYLLVYRRKVLAETFFSVVGESKAQFISSTQFDFVAFALLVVSIFSMGLLFTLALLLVPSTMTAAFASYATSGNRHLTLAGLLGASGVSLGFGISLVWEDIPTVPSVVVCLTLLSFSLGLVSRMLRP